MPLVLRDRCLPWVTISLACLCYFCQSFLFCTKADMSNRGRFIEELKLQAEKKAPAAGTSSGPPGHLLRSLASASQGPGIPALSSPEKQRMPLGQSQAARRLAKEGVGFSIRRGMPEYSSSHLLPLGSGGVAPGEGSAAEPLHPSIQPASSAARPGLGSGLAALPRNTRSPPPREPQPGRLRNEARVGENTKSRFGFLPGPALDATLAAAPAAS